MIGLKLLWTYFLQPIFPQGIALAHALDSLRSAILHYALNIGVKQLNQVVRTPQTQVIKTSDPMLTDETKKRTQELPGSREKISP